MDSVSLRVAKFCRPWPVPQCVDALAQIIQDFSSSSTFSAQILGEDMVSSDVGSFTKLAACPSSKTLLEYRLAKLAPEMTKLVRWHLEECDFCWAEMKLLIHHAGPEKEDGRPPSIPVNLRVLAEALLINSKSAKQTFARQTKR